MTDQPEDCIHGLDPRTCSTCLHGPLVEEPEQVEGRPFVARYSGRCCACEEPITEGVDTIVKTTRDRYLHLECLGAGA